MNPTDANEWLAGRCVQRTTIESALVDMSCALYEAAGACALSITLEPVAFAKLISEIGPARSPGMRVVKLVQPNGTELEVRCGK